MDTTKKIVISCGPIPARLDSVKFITNRFKGGLAFKTTQHLIDHGYDTTVVIWKHTSLPDVNGVPASGYWLQDHVHIVTVEDVFDYYKWFSDNAGHYDAFIMAAAVANLTPCQPYGGKFPSHNYKVGESFDIKFEIAPRAIDVIKQVNPRACLIGYKLFDAKSDEELVDIARHTLKDTKANIIFANTPATAKSKKIAVMADNSALPCTFQEHLDLIVQAIEAKYFRTSVVPLTPEEQDSPDIKEAFATAKMFEQTFPGFGTVAVPIAGCRNMFATTSRGHSGAPVLVRRVDACNMTIQASGKATLNAPTLAAALEAAPDVPGIVVHRHFDDPLFSRETPGASLKWYVFPGTLEEADLVYSEILNLNVLGGTTRIILPEHGDIAFLPIRPIQWERYYQDFPDRYFGTPQAMQGIIDKYAGNPHAETLEVGCNSHACTKYAYDPFVKADNAINLTWEETAGRQFDLIVAKNSINYLTLEELRTLVGNARHFVANTFLCPPAEKIRDGLEAAIMDKTSASPVISHTLRLKDDSIIRHQFFAYTEEDYSALGLTVTPYGRNSALLTK